MVNLHYSCIIGLENMYLYRQELQYGGEKKDFYDLQNHHSTASLVLLCNLHNGVKEFFLLDDVISDNFFIPILQFGACKGLCMRLKRSMKCKQMFF